MLLFSHLFTFLPCQLVNSMQVFVDQRFWNSNSYLSRAVFLQVFVFNVGHYELISWRSQRVWNLKHSFSLLLWLMETSTLSSDFRGLTNKRLNIWLFISSENFTRERSVAKLDGNAFNDIWHFVCHAQCSACFGGVSYYRSYMCQSNIPLKFKGIAPHNSQLQCIHV